MLCFYETLTRILLYHKVYKQFNMDGGDYKYPLTMFVFHENHIIFVFLFLCRVGIGYSRHVLKGSPP